MLLELGARLGGGLALHKRLALRKEVGGQNVVVQTVLDGVVCLCAGEEKMEKLVSPAASVACARCEERDIETARDKR